LRRPERAHRSSSGRNGGREEKGGREKRAGIPLPYSLANRTREKRGKKKRGGGKNRLESLVASPEREEWRGEEIERTFLPFRLMREKEENECRKTFFSSKR